MSKNCRIEFVEGELTCLCNHRDYRNCDLYEEDDETYDDWGEEKMKIKVKKSADYYKGWNDALKDLHSYLMESYQTEFDWEDINQAIKEVEMPTEEL